MPRVELPLADGFYISQSGPLIEKRCVNLVPTFPEADAAAQKVLFGTPGIVEFTNVLSGSSRGVLVFSTGVPYRVIGNSFYCINSDGTFTNFGTVSGNGPVSMASNGINIAIVDPVGDSYFFTPSTGTLELNNDAVFLDFGQATSVAFKDGFYVYTTDSIFFSSSAKTINDGKDFNALDFEDAEINPDEIVKAFNNHNQLYIAGTNTTQIYRTIQTTDFPFQLIPGAIIQKGVRARDTMIQFDESFVFLGGGENEKPAIYRALGSNVQKISTRSIDFLLHQLTPAQIAAASAYAYAENGNYFAVFNFGPHTLVYDQTTSGIGQAPSWHERQTGITSGFGFQPWRAKHGALVDGKIQVADDRSGLIGTLETDIYTEYGALIERILSTKPFVDRGEKLFSRELELYMQTGVGNSLDADPKIRMDYSDDGSRTFRSELTVSIGKKGEYKRRVRWKRLGAIPLSRVVRWKTTAISPINIYALFANAEVTTRG